MGQASHVQQRKQRTFASQPGWCPAARLHRQRAAQPRLLHVASACGLDSNLCRQGFWLPRRRMKAGLVAACR